MKTLKELREDNAKKKALITGFPGQDATYMAVLLDFLGYGDITLVARRETPLVDQRFSALANVTSGVTYVTCELTDKAEVDKILFIYQPDEVYHYAARSHVGDSFDTAALTVDNNIKATLNLLDAIPPSCKMFHAGTSEIIGNGSYHMERPVSPYALGKQFCHNMCNLYLKMKRKKSVSVITHNHDSPLRGENFLIPSLMKRIDQAKAFGKDHIVTGVLLTSRDYSFAGDIVIDAWWLLQNEDQWEEYMEFGSAVATTGKDIFNKLKELFEVPDLIDRQLMQGRPIEVWQLRASKDRIYRPNHHRMSIDTLLSHMFCYHNRNELEALEFYVKYLEEVWEKYEDFEFPQTEPVEEESK